MEVIHIINQIKLNIVGSIEISWSLDNHLLISLHNVSIRVIQVPYYITKWKLNILNSENPWWVNNCFLIPLHTFPLKAIFYVFHADFFIKINMHNCVSIPLLLKWKDVPFYQVVKVEHCERVQIITAAKRICIANCRECIFYLGVNHQPLIVGDNHKLQVSSFFLCHQEYEIFIKKNDMCANV